MVQNPNRFVAKIQISNTVLSCIFGELQNVASYPQRRTIPPETLQLQRKTIPPKKLQRNTIPPGTPQGGIFPGRGASSREYKRMCSAGDVSIVSFASYAVALDLFVDLCDG